MKQKALGNLDAAQLLINTQDIKYCTASIHCSYYAVFQYMKYVLAHTDREPVSYVLQSKLANDHSSHGYIIDQIKQRIVKPKDARDFVQDIRALKRDRVDADYEARLFSVDESLECRQQADRLIRKLKTYFGNI